MKSTHPSPRILLRTWAVLMALSLGTMIAGRVDTLAALGPLSIMALLIVTGIKVRLILARFLNLRAASADWNSGFTTLLVVLLLSILAAFFAGYLPVFENLHR